VCLSFPRPRNLRHTSVHISRANYSSLALLVLLACPFTIAGRAPQDTRATSERSGCTLRIHVDGLRNSMGVVGSVIFKSADGWPEDTKKCFRHGPTPIASGQRQATVVWEHLPAGDYGVAVIHDENSNARLDRNFIGIPKEGFGFANNPHVGLSAPPFPAAIVHVQCPFTDTDIHLQYK
jgi:uncharacterized protein (DUF2141 family)